MKTQPISTTDDYGALMSDLLGTLTLQKPTMRTQGGAWIRGTMAGHIFEALVFKDHAVYESYELDGSRISKLWLQQCHDNAIVASFDRGWDIQPTTVVAGQIVELLAAGLAETVFDQ